MSAPAKRRADWKQWPDTSTGTVDADDFDYWDEAIHELKTTDVINVKDYGALCDARRVKDASTSVGSTAVTSATIAFTAADIGKRLYIAGAHVGGAMGIGTIQTVISATQATVNFAMSFAVTNAELIVATDDVAAINSAIQAGSPVVLIPESCAVSTAIVMRRGLILRGAGSDPDPAARSPGSGEQALDDRGFRAPTTIVAFGIGASVGVIDTVLGMRDFAIEDLSIIHGRGGTTTAVDDSRVSGHRGIYIRDSCLNWRISRVSGDGASQGIYLSNTREGVLEDVHWYGAKNHGLLIYGVCNNITTKGHTLFQVCGGGITANDCSNVAVIPQSSNIAYAIKFDHRLWDEAATQDDSCLYIEKGEDITVNDFEMYPIFSGYGIRLAGTGCKRITIRGGRIEPFLDIADRLAAATISIGAGAEDTVLEDISTKILAGATDIVDNGTRTVWRNVNGINKFATKAGVPVDGDYSLTPPDGTYVWDSTNHKLSVRSGGVWKQSASFT